MARLVLGVAGAVLGGMTGLPFGAQLGWALGSALGASFQDPQRVEGPMLADLRVTGVEYGQPIPYVIGHPRVPGQIWWASAKRPIAHTTTSGGGKGDGPSVESTTYTYEVDLLIGLTDNEIAGVSRVWLNGELIYSTLASSSEADLAASADNGKWSRFTVYTGDADQEPDPTYEAAVGASIAVAYRGRGSVFIEDLDLGSSGQIPQLTFEVYTASLPGTPSYENLGSQSSPYPLAAFQNAFIGFGTAATPSTIYVGHSGWDNSYVRPFEVSAYAYDVNSDAFTFHREFEVFTNSADGSTTNVYTCSTNVSTWCGYSNRVGFERIEFYDLYSGASYPSGQACNRDAVWAGVPVVARSGNTVLVGENASGASGRILQRFDLSSGSTAQATNTNAPGFSNLYICDDGYAYGIDQGSALVYQINITTLAVLQSFPVPSGFSGVGGLLFSSGDSQGLGLWFAGLSGALVKLYSLDDGSPNTWTLEASFTPSPAVTDLHKHTCERVGGYFYLGVSELANPIILHRFGTFSSLTPDDVSVASAVGELCERAGLSASQYDTSGLSGITREVRALAITQIGPMRGPIDMLGGMFFFEYLSRDKIYFVARGGSAAATLPYADLGAAEEGAREFNPLVLHQANDIELPAQVAITYPNATDDYQNDTQYSDRALDSEQTVETMLVPLAMTASEAKQVADARLWDRVVSGLSTQVKVTCEYAALEPTDAIVLTDEDGSTYRMRIVRREDAFPLITLDCVLDDASILTSQGITSADYTASTSVAGASDTVLALLDIPILRDADDDAGFYAAARGSLSPWPGASVLRSSDDASFTGEATITESGVVGDCVTVLSGWTGGRVFDETSTLRVDVGTGTLASSTRSAMISDESVNAAAVGSDVNGWEVIQFRTATLVGTGVYDLTGFLRGARGTEWMSSRHVAGEQFVLLRLSGLRRIAMSSTQLGTSYYWRGVTLGRGIDTDTSETMANDGAGLMPFAPYQLRLARDPVSGDITITWRRRSRLATRWVGSLGPSCPLGEESESYEVDIVAPGSPDTVVRTITASTNSATYTAAQQTTDFGSPTPGTFRVRIYQISATVGRGYAKEVTA